MARPSIETDGGAIRLHRELAGWNRVPFAKHIGVSPGHLAKLETGHASASPAMLKRIADALDLQVRDLVRVKTPTPA